MSAVTVLYAPRDEALGMQIADALTRQGHVPRRPVRAHPHNGDLSLDDDAAIIVWSNAALRIARLHEQARDALARGTLIPIAVDGAAPPGEFEALPPVDLSGWRGDESDPRWRFVLEEIELAAQRRGQAGDAAPLTATGRAENGDPSALVAAPRRPRRRSRFRPIPVALAGGTALAALTVAAVLLAPSPQPAPTAAAPALRTLALVAPVDAAKNTSAAAAETAEETPSDFEITVTRDPADPPPDDPETAAQANDLSTDETLTDAGAEESALPETETAAIASAQPGEATLDGAAMERLVAEATAGGDDGAYFRDCADCPQMARIPAGRFTMGSPVNEPARQASEGPLREVAIAKGFALSAREVTFAQWDVCVADGGCRAYRPYDYGWGRGARPVVGVSFEDAQSYAAWLSQKTGKTYRLPSEAEWEYAARAGRTGPFAFDGLLTPQKANYDAEYPYGGEKAEPRGKTTPTGSFAPNAFGLYDMHGNVWEWTADCWADTLAGAPADGRPRAADAVADCGRRALKGGAWNTGGWRLRAGHRIGKAQTAREFDNGFRVARELD